MRANAAERNRPSAGIRIRSGGDAAALADAVPAVEAGNCQSLPALFAVRRIDERVDGYAAARSEFPDDLDILGLQEFREIVMNYIDHVFMEIAMVAEAEEIQLQAFRLHEPLAGNIADCENGEIRLPRLRAERGEFRRCKRDPVIAAAHAVGECFEDGGIVIGGSGAFAAQRFQSIKIVSHCVDFCFSGKAVEDGAGRKEEEDASGIWLARATAVKPASPANPFPSAETYSDAAIMAPPSAAESATSSVSTRAPNIAATASRIPRERLAPPVRRIVEKLPIQRVRA